ncbi:hypothetical protein EDEG_00202 [Edhazardia aedis USNM 41457]|uniref:Acid phosphatase n=1 Tax=Edhazardia aedis (strain USNM 41457) TaxID=1003232 RepID=J9DLQ2_EDHAE|nr:hypothetical protein EDEG_00202 [Edhazardia aedis USNM 41457]|eukprot:EJW03520.1 hypothetical protein EDEG_00202 [Edhazardia aedis USNM 41457]
MFTSDLKLILVNIFHRHGERTPLKGYDKPIGRYELCKEVDGYNLFIKKSPKSSFSIFIDKISNIFNPMRIKSSAIFKYSYIPPKNSECAPGQLTDFGKNTLYQFGKKLNKDYIGTNFLSHNYSNKDINLVSTEFQRTIESLQWLILGMFKSIKKPIEINIQRKGLNGAYASNYFEDFKSARIKHRKAILESRKKDIKTVSNYFNDFLIKFTGNKNFKITGIYEIFDIIMCSGGNKRGLFNSFNTNMYNIAEEICIDMFFGLLKNKKHFSVYAGDLISDLCQKISKKIINPSENPKMYIFSGHDTTIFPILHIFGLSNNEWPKFGANIIFETFMSKEQKYYIRIKYNDQILSIPRCKKHYNRDKSFCEIKDFFDICKSYTSGN